MLAGCECISRAPRLDGVKGTQRSGLYVYHIQLKIEMTVSEATALYLVSCNGIMNITAAQPPSFPAVGIKPRNYPEICSAVETRWGACERRARLALSMRVHFWMTDCPLNYNTLSSTSLELLNRTNGKKWEGGYNMII